MIKLTSSSRRKFLQLSTIACISNNSVAPKACTHQSKEEICIRTSVHSAIQNVIADGADHLFPEQFEVARLASDTKFRQSTIEKISQNLLLPPERISPLRVSGTFIPKIAQQSYRLVSWMSAFDAIRYLASSILIVQEIASPSATSFSNQYSPSKDGKIFEDNGGYQAFSSEVLDWLSKERAGVLVHTDIVDCYSNIKFERLIKFFGEAGVVQWRLMLLDRLLIDWNAQWGGGLPVGSNASHLLAESFLAEVDRELVRHGIKFVRYVDDYRLMAPDQTTAQFWLVELSKALARRGLSLNQKKTFISSLAKEDYERLLEERAIARQWGSVGLDTFVNIETARRDSRHDDEDKFEDSDPGKNKKDHTPHNPCPYNCPMPPKKGATQHPTPNAADLAILKRTSASGLLESLKVDASSRGYLSVGNCRLLMESALLAHEHEIILESLVLLKSCPSAVAIFVNALVRERDVIPAHIRSQVSKAFGAWLQRGNMQDFQVVHIAQLLGTLEYANADALKDAFDKRCQNSQPYVARAVLSAYRNLNASTDDDLVQKLRSQIDPLTACAIVHTAKASMASSSSLRLAFDGDLVAGLCLDAALLGTDAAS